MDNNYKFTADKRLLLDEIQAKVRIIRNKHREYKQQFEKLVGSVFDGGFDWIIDKDKMTEEERQEFNTIEESIKLINKIFK